MYIVRMTYLHMFEHGVQQAADHPSKYAGLAATMIGIISFLPVLHTVYKTRKTTNFPYEALCLALVSNALWIYYGYSKPHGIDYQVLMMGALYFVVYLSILYVKMKP